MPHHSIRVVYVIHFFFTHASAAMQAIKTRAKAIIPVIATAASCSFIHRLYQGELMQDRYDLWVDLTQEYNGYHQSLTKFAKNPSGIHKGERIRVGDHDGRRAIATVVEVRYDTVVILDVDVTTYYTVPGWTG